MAAIEGDGEDRASRPVAFEVSGGLTLRGDAFGAAGDPVVLFLHGGGQTRHSWSGTAARLGPEGWNAITLDLRGHGESDWAPDGDYAWVSFVRDLHAVLARFEHPPVVVGASLGGLTALLAEGESGESLMSAVVLVDVTPRMERSGIERIIEFMTDRPDGYADLEEVADAVAAYNPHRKRRPDPTGLLKNLRLGDDGRYRWHWDPAFLTRSGVHPDAAPPDAERLLRAASRLAIPTLLVRGQVSDIVSEQGAREFLAAAPHARFVDVSGAGHMVASDRNDAFSEGVIAFLRELPRR
jgi:pimeloyl-ACP methyl ester carboxylesterase